MLKELVIYKPKSVQKQVSVVAPTTGSIVDVVSERLGADAGAKAKRLFAAMQKDGVDFMQFKVGEQRVRLKQDVAAN